VTAVRLISYATLIVALLALALYALAPVLLAWAIPVYLESRGVAHSEFTFSRPGLSGWTIERAVIVVGSFEVVAQGAVLGYRTSTLRSGRLQTIDIDSVDVSIAPSEDPLVIDVPPLWSIIPADHLAVRKLTIDNQQPAARVAGDFAFDPARARADLQIDSAALPAPLDAHVLLEPQGGVDVALTQRGLDTPALRLTGVPDGAGIIVLDGEFDLAGPTLALLSDLIGLDAAQGHIRGRIDAQAPWPLSETMDWQSVRASAAMDIVLSELVPFARGEMIAGEVTLSLADGRARINAPALTLTAGSVDWQGRRYEIGPESKLVVTAGATAPWPNPLGSGGDWSAVQVDGSVLVSLAEAMPALTGDSLIGKLSFGLASGRAVIDTPAMAIKARSIQYRGVRYDIDDASALTIVGKMGVPWPLPEGSPLALVTVNGRIEVTLASSSEDAAALTPWANVNGSAAIAMAGQTATITVDAGSGLELSVAPVNEIALETRTPLPIRWRLADGAIDAIDVSLALRVPELSVADQRLALRSAQFDAARVAVAGNQLKLQKARFTTRTAAQALPLMANVTLNLDTLVGRFDARASGKITRALLKTELSGWRSDYDLDGGALTVELAGTFGAPDSGLQIEGNGRAKLVDGVAHAGDTVVGGLQFDLPVRIGPTDYSAGPAPVRIGTVDPGVPVTDVEFGLQVDSQHAVLTTVGAQLLGGRAAVDRIDYDLAAGTTQFVATLDGVQLPALLALEGEDIVGDGVLDGRLPIVVEPAGMVVDGGRIDARPPGGRLSYRGRLAAPAPGLDLAIKALRNFQYEGLSADVDYAVNGVLTLAVKLRGRSPDVEKGRPIHFNLNLTEDVPALLESLRASDSITERVQQQFSR
jgi:hypothetical protein